MEKVAIVILNYLNYTDTIECIDSIKNDDYLNKEIIVVDNGSNNESWSILNKKYTDLDVHLVKSNENLGFAKGNNLGIDYARNVLKAEFVLLVNNDTIFNNTNIIKNLMEAYEENVGVIGPRIISSDNKEQNPVNAIITKERILEEYDIYKSIGYKCYHSTFYTKLRKNQKFNQVKNKLKKIIKGNKASVNEVKFEDIIKENQQSEELVLHGACMMLTKDYFKYYPRLFPDTFLYYEENILTLLTKKVGIKKKFINNCSIFHKEDQSSQMSFSNLSKVKMKFLKESMKVCEGLFDMTYNEIISKYFI